MMSLLLNTDLSHFPGDLAKAANDNEVFVPPAKAGGNLRIQYTSQ